MSLDSIARGLTRQIQLDLASSVAGQGSGKIGFLASGVSAAGRTVQAKLRDVVSVKDFGAIGDGSTDDTAAIQAAITATLGASGGCLVFPDGSYKITAKLVVPVGYGWEMRGASRGGARLVQFTANTPILSLEGANSHSFVIEKLLFSWNTQQTIAQTNAVAIKMGSGVANVSFYYWQVRDCFFQRGCRGIAADPANTPLLWGFTIDNCVFNAEMCGAAIYIPTAGAGQPRATISNNHFVATNAGEDHVQLGVMDTITLINNEWNGGNAPYRLLLAQGITALTFIGNRSESYNTGTTSNQQIFNFANCRVLAINTYIGNLVGSGPNTICIHNNVNTVISILGLTIASAKSGGSTVGYTAGSAENVVMVMGYSSSGSAVTEVSGTNVRWFADRRQYDGSTDLGDVSVTLTATSTLLQYQNVTLTANRTITLPSSGQYEGMEFEIVRRAATPGAFTLTVTDPIAANNHVFASSTNGYVRYRYNSGAWRRIMSAS